ncbi:LytR/AlgR family response regulator transcription factor [Geosporobacter ferrireducens]|uniref:Stage 0 sporulation protein A homolog n=1 Tax=Geosporobacter ferrireducens TaxID=1424294 RepID=A0A1D8GJ37_9FIRM|nr:LytTR family DNA-binding domain-containing protein [Geosporobacter ferrireducens]AOT70920.1 DNA-binding response regulator [Geosporobacter ferrireducens]MTI53626.1 response regulator transcription factor [Geosporobacter ferrireducens]
MLNILVVEDDQIERKNFVEILKHLNGDMKVFEASTGTQAVRIMEQEEIGLFFLDIELPDCSGLKVAEKIRSIRQYELTYIVFITTHVYYQLEAFKKYNCYDFIEKPYKREEVLRVSERLIRGLQYNNTEGVTIRFELKNCILKIPVKDILFIEAQGKNCRVHTKYTPYTLPNTAINKVLEKVPAVHFIKTHKSYIVNLENVRQIEKNEKNSWIVYFRDYAAPAYISNSYKEEFLKKFQLES